MKLLILSLLFSFLSFSLGISAPEAFEVDDARFDQLPGGKEADGILGDFILRNDRIEAVISQNAPFRKANMGTFWGAGGTTQGCLYDLSLRGSGNDQLTIFAPLGLKGGVSYVRLAEDCPEGEVAVETVITAAKGAGLYTQHRYRVRDGWQGVLVTTTLRNETKLKRKVKLRDTWTKFTSSGIAGDIHWADAVDPADKCGYAYRWEWKEGSKPGEITLSPGQELNFDRFVAVGTSPLDAVGLILQRAGNVDVVSGKLNGPGGKPVVTADITATVNGKTLKGYPNEKGHFSFRMPQAEKHRLKVSDIGREGIELELKPDENPATVTLSADSAIAFDIKDEAGVSIPCKAQFNGVGDTPSPNLGPNNRAHGCLDQYHSEKGRFRVAVPPGKYRVVVTHGMEYSHIERVIDVKAGSEVTIVG